MSAPEEPDDDSVTVECPYCLDGLVLDEVGSDEIRESVCPYCSNEEVIAQTERMKQEALQEQRDEAAADDHMDKLRDDRYDREHGFQ